MNVRSGYLATTLAVLAIGLGLGLSQWRPHPALARPAVRTTAQPARPAVLPTASEILDRAGALGLSRQQASRLRELDRQWQTESRPLGQAIRTTSAEFERFVVEARRGGGASVPELQRRSADLQALSAELRERRAEHSRHAVETLTDAQRDALRREPVKAVGGRA
jgi:hypothetical protein